MLLLTRQRILGRLGCSTEMVMNAPAYRTFFDEECPRVVVFCQTLTREERSDALRFAAEQCPGSHLLVMFNSTQTCSPEQGYVLFDARNGPAAFSQSISELLCLSWSIT